jgi:plasmid stabilization system protein ParE
MSDFAIHPAARAEYEVAIDWYAQQSPLAASRFVSAVDAAIEAIRKHPADFTRLDDTHHIYLLNKFPYFVAYRYTEEQVTIVAIRHTSRDESGWTER